MPAFQRNLQRVEQGLYDLLIVGGGIAGLSVAEDAAGRGLRVLLLERGDFGSETSSGCFRLVHGGMRYLQHLDFARMFASVREQKILRERAPHLVKPVPFLIPCYGNLKEGRWLLEAGMSLYEMLCFQRNVGIRAEDKLQRHVFVPRDEFLRIAPGTALNNDRGEPLRGAMRFWDCQMKHADRLALAVGMSAAESGAAVLNYSEVDALEFQDSAEPKFIATVRDVCTGAEYRAEARCVVNAAGPWAGLLLRKWFGKSAVDSSPELSRRTLSKGFQVVLPEVVRESAVAISSVQEDAASIVRRGKRSFFLVPWQGLTLAGTTDEPYSGSADDFSVSFDEVRDFIDSLRRGYNSPNLAVDSVKQVFGGLLPAESVSTDGSSPERIRILRDDIVFEQAGTERRVKGMLTVVGVKYTTCRALAEATVDRVLEFLDRPKVPSRTAGFSLFRNGNPILAELDLLRAEGELSSEFGKSLPASERTFNRLITSYGERAADVLGIAVSRRETTTEEKICGAEVEYAVKNEMARTVPDVVFRRTFLGIADKPKPAVLQFVSGIVAEQLSWSDEERRDSERQVLLDKRFAFRPN